MNRRDLQLSEIGRLIAKHTPAEGIHCTCLSSVMLAKESESHGRVPWLYEPALILAAQGKKYVYLDGQRYEYSAGKFFAVFLPMATEGELLDVSKEKPLLAIGIRLDRHRLASLLLKIDKVDHMLNKPEVTNTSGIFSAALNDHLVDATIRLLNTLDDPLEAAILGEQIIDEIYYRLLINEQGGALRSLLRQQGQMQQISKAVDYLHKKLATNISVDELAEIVNMSTSGFHKKFKEVMHLSPLQYTKLVRLNKAKTYLMEGKNVSEAGYMVGYNSPAQFSREYKRQFGIAPSASTALST